jgi:hypothetical protein
MSEDYRIITQPRAEPRSVGDVGVCVRIRLSGYPSRRWSRDLGARLTNELVGHSNIGHLRVNVNDIVQGDEIVLDGVEDREAPAIASALQRAVDGANHAAPGEGDPRPNVPQQEADAVAEHLVLNQPGDESCCPCCSQPLSITTADGEAGDQLALNRRSCPSCGTLLMRDVDGHADRGWRPA